MANRGAFTANLGDPIYAIEATFNGETTIKTYPSVAGLKHGIKATDYDVKAWNRYQGPGYASMRTLICKNPQWEDFTP